MVEGKIELDKWIYLTFGKYRNVALPNKFIEIDRDKLANHFARKFKCRVRIRECEMKSYEPHTLKVCSHKYLVVEQI